MKSRSLVIGALILALLALTVGVQETSAKTLVLSYSDLSDNQTLDAENPGDVHTNDGDPDDWLGGDGADNNDGALPIKDQGGGYPIGAGWLERMLDLLTTLRWRF